MATEVEFAGVKFTGGKMFALITALSTLGTGAWGAFEFYSDYMDMKEQIQSYVAPDLSGFQEQLSVMETQMMGVEDSVLAARDYTRDIKIDLKADIDRMESILDDTDRSVREIDIAVRDQLSDNIDEMRDIVDSADERFDNKRDSLQADNERRLKELEERINNQIQRVLNNPLSD